MKITLKSWWGPRAAVLCIVVFAGIAALPLIRGGISAAEKGKPLSLSTIMEETKRKNKENKKKKPEKLGEFKAAAQLENGTLYLGGKGGLLVRIGEQWTLVKDGPADEIKNLAAIGNTLWIAGKHGLYQLLDGKYSEVKSGDFHSVTAAPDGSIFAVSKKSIYSCDPAGKWSELNVDLSAITLASKKSDH